MKKIFTLMLATVMALAAFAGCTNNNDSKSDSEYVKEKGTLIVGITEFKPMDYRDENGNWIGFDADMASAFAESLGVKAEFVVIEWGSKIMELNGKNIDCVWNGMTLNDEVLMPIARTHRLWWYPRIRPTLIRASKRWLI